MNIHACINGLALHWVWHRIVIDIDNNWIVVTKGQFSNSWLCFRKYHSRFVSFFFRLFFCLTSFINKCIVSFWRKVNSALETVKPTGKLVWVSINLLNYNNKVVNRCTLQWEKCLILSIIIYFVGKKNLLFWLNGVFMNE